MKRKIMISLCVLLGLSGCKMDLSVNQAEDLPLQIGMNQGTYVKQAELTDNEKLLLEMATDNKVLILDYKVGENVRSIRLSANYLNNEKGEWERQDLGATSINDPDMLDASDNGRIMLNIENEYSGIEIVEISNLKEALNGNKTMIRWNQSDNNTVDFGGMAVSSYTSTPYEYVENQEIVLFQQIATSGNTIRSMGGDAFNHPEELAEQNYDYVCVYTIEFSTEPLK